MKSIASHVLLLLALLGLAPASFAEDGYSGVTTRGNLSVWRIRHDTGAVSLCSFEGHFAVPSCYPWSEGTEGKNFEIIPGDDVLSTWRINAATGAVSLCEYKEITAAPVCTPWSTE